MKNQFKKIFQKLKNLPQYSGKALNYVKGNWWWLLLIAILLFTTIIFFTPYSERLVQWAKVLTEVLTPFTLLLGVILGYPLLRKRLTEQYVMKQFEIRDVANREVRHKVIELLDEYPISYISNRLTLEYIQKALSNISELRRLALDSQPDVYRYVNLLYKTLKNLEEIYTHFDSESFPHRNYEENLSRWLHNQLKEVYDYSKSIGSIPTGETIIKPKLNKTISPFVNHNSVTEIRDVEHSIEYRQNEAMLVLFFGTSNDSLSGDNVELYKATYEAAPSPCPFARLLINNSIYFPLVLKSKEKYWFMHGELMLIGYRKKKSTNLNGEEYNYYECIYANLSHMGFVNTTITELDKLDSFRDGYLDMEADLKGFYELEKFGHEIVSIKISHKNAQEAFFKVKQTLITTLKTEL